MTDFSWTPYTPRFYTQQTDSEETAEVNALARAIVHVFRPTFVGDVGCGRGQFLKVFQETGCRIWGTDGEPASRAGFLVNPSHVDVQDFRNGVLLPCGLDLLVCLEVVEHLPAEDADALVKVLCRSSARTIVFSGAYPGQGGTGHINERPTTYWADLFRRHGRVYDSFGTNAVLDVWERFNGGKPKTCTWYRTNLRCFKT